MPNGQYITRQYVSAIVASDGGGGSPAYVAEIASTRLSEASSNSTSVLTVTSSVSIGQKACVAISWSDASQTLTSVTDSKGNTWAIDNNLNYSSIYNRAIASSNITNALSNGDSITANWGSAGFSYRGMAAFSISGATALDQTTKNTAFGTAVSASASTTATATTLIAIVAPQDNTQTYSSSAWTVIGAAHDFGGTNRSYYAYKNASTSGSQDPAGSFTSNNTWGAVWTAYKP